MQLRRRGRRSSGEMEEAKAGADGEEVLEGRHIGFVVKVIR